MSNAITHIKIATRESPLALAQTKLIKQKLEALYTQVTISIVGFTTTGDIKLDTPLYDVGGKGLFTKELEQALLDNRADIAVHSIKDMPAESPPGLIITAICEREDPRDCFISEKYNSLAELPQGAVLGTSSLRRQSQLLHMRPDLTVVSLRGNVNTRLRKLAEGQYDAIILAAAGIKRLGMDNLVKEYYSEHVCVPAAGQGALAIQCRSQDQALIKLLAALNHQPTAKCVLAERAFNARLDAGCKTPIAAYAILQGEQVHLTGLIGRVDGSEIIRDEQVGVEPEVLGTKLAETLIKRGGAAILAELKA